MTSAEKTHAAVRAVISEVTGIPETDLTLEKDLTDDLDLDSLAIAEIAVAIEEKLGVRIPDDAVGDLRTVSDIVDYLMERGGAE